VHHSFSGGASQITMNYAEGELRRSRITMNSAEGELQRSELRAKSGTKADKKARAGQLTIVRVSGWFFLFVPLN